MYSKLSVKYIQCIMLYQSIVNLSDKSTFRRSFDLQHRIAKRKSMIKLNKDLNYCCLVIEYELNIQIVKKYELMCVDGKLNLKILQEFILKKMKYTTVRPNLLFYVRGKIKNPSENIGVLSKSFSEQDGFLYIFIRGQNTF